jgi:hypothetical protein
MDVVDVAFLNESLSLSLSLSFSGPLHYYCPLSLSFLLLELAPQIKMQAKHTLG